MSEIVWNKSAVKENVNFFSSLCTKNKCSLSFVTKSCLSYPELVAPVIHECSIHRFCDSNAGNFNQVFAFCQKLSPGYDIEACLIKTSLSSVDYVYSHVDLSLNKVCFFVSDEIVLEKISSMPQFQNVSVVLIVENGDLKDGFYPEQVSRISRNYPKLNIKGISTNFACLSGKLPTVEKIIELSALAALVAQNRGNSPFLSVGGTVMYDLLEQCLLDNLVQEVRIGEGIFFGYNSSAGRTLEKLRSDVCLLKGEIIEVSEKEVLADSGGGYNAFGQKSQGSVSGRRRRAVLDIGVLGAGQQDLLIKDTESFFAGQTFDFTVIDITDSHLDYKAGDFVMLGLNYASASQLMMNSFVVKKVV